MIIDAHHHFWKYNRVEYGWMDGSMGVLKRDYLPAELEQEITRAGVSGTIAVQARQSLEETRWLLDLAGDHPFIRGVVGWVDLRSPLLDEQLEEFRDHPLLVGARHVIHDEPEDDFMLQPAFLKGIETLGKYNLAYDLLLFPRHLVTAAELAGMLPEHRFVLDHLSKPPIKDGLMQPWNDDLLALAARSNVWCKISGMVTEADLSGWRYEDFIPYMDAVVEAFGPDRIMLGSDWPVCRLGGRYEKVMGIPGRYFDSFPGRLRNRIFFQNAIDCYQLKPEKNEKNR